MKIGRCLNLVLLTGFLAVGGEETAFAQTAEELYRDGQAARMEQRFDDAVSLLELARTLDPENADIVWLVYDLVLNEQNNEYQLILHRSIYTLFNPSLDQIITPEAGTIGEFVEHLQEKLEEKLDGDQNPPDAPTLDELL